mgnify:FL=1
MSRSATFLTPRVGDGEAAHDWALPAAAADTVVLYMASQQAQAIRDGLLAAGVPASRPAVFVENASLPNRRVVPVRLGELTEAAALLGGGPTLLFLGEVYQGIVTEAERGRAPLRRTA